MQKLIQRAKVFERTAKKKLVKGEKLRVHWRNKEQWQRDLQDARSDRERVRLERKNRRIAYELGPLAPQRSIGKDAESYGTIEGSQRTGPEIREKRRRKQLPFAVNDRVVLIRGKDQGRIGKVLEVSKDTEEVIVENINMVDFSVPEYIRQSFNAPLSSGERAISIDDVRLVHPLKAKGGTLRDVVVRNVEFGRPYRERDIHGKLVQRVDRYIAGTKTLLPWPEEETPEEEQFPADTSRLESEKPTWIPTMASPPMPPAVLDELRGKYSKFRTRHEDWYIAQRETEERIQTGRASNATMLTPFQELKRKVAEQKRVQGPPSMTLPMWTAIGRAMARNLDIDVQQLRKYDHPPKPRPDADRLVLIEEPSRKQREAELEKAVTNLLGQIQQSGPSTQNLGHLLQLKSDVTNGIQRLEHLIARHEARQTL